MHGLTALQILRCGENQLTSLDVQGLPALQVLMCYDNRLTALDVQGLTALQLLGCWDNQLTALNVQDLPALWVLGFQRNRFKEDAVIRILNALPDWSEDKEGYAVLYAEEDSNLKESGSAVPASAEFRAAFDSARAKNWKLYIQTEEGKDKEIELPEK